MTNRRTYTREFKLEAVKMVVEQGRPVKEVAANLGINANLLHNWKTAFVEDGSVAFPGHGKLKPEDAWLSKPSREARRCVALTG